jgi:hypothetical protein
MNDSITALYYRTFMVVINGQTVHVKGLFARPISEADFELG